MNTNKMTIKSEREGSGAPDFQRREINIPRKRACRGFYFSRPIRAANTSLSAIRAHLRNLIRREHPCGLPAAATRPTPAGTYSGFRFASFAPLRAVSLSEQEAAHVALRAACGRLTGQRPLARVQVSDLHSTPVTDHSQHDTAAQQPPPPSQNTNF